MIEHVRDGATYTVAQLETIAGRELADRARRLAGIKAPAAAEAETPAPAPRRGSSTRAPRRRAAPINWQEPTV